MRINMVRIFAFFPRLIVEFLPGLFVDFFHWLFPSHARHYFVADEVVFQITHPAPTPAAPRAVVQANVLAAVRSYLPFNRNFLQEVIVSLLPAAGNEWRNRLTPPPGSPTQSSPNSPTPTSRIITISSAEPFSLVPVRVAWHSRSGLRPAAVGRVLQVAYTELQNGPINLGNGISLQSISPNWFAKNLHHGGSTGGPGSWPVEASVPRPAGTGSIGQHEFRLAATMGSLNPYKNRIIGGNVHVAILDTAPLTDYQNVVQGLMQKPSVAASPVSSLIQNLFTILNIHPYFNPANRNELTNLYRYTPPPYHYKMPDHGTYIAGIIHTIAPTAMLHLYEVLNSFGLGTLTSMTQGLINAVDAHYEEGKTSLIINCSFVLDLITEQGQSNIDKVLDVTNPNISGLLTRSARGVFAWATGLKNVVVIAAAGNEADSTGRPDAKYPAAFQGVVGVGALPRGNPINSGVYTPATYSNSSFSARESKLSNQGFMTFGGELDNPYPAADNVPISTKGVLGIYIGELLNPNTTNTTTTVRNAQWIASTTGWAHWAGTSFAAPIITGLLAAQPGDPSISTATAPPAIPLLTAVGENVILVEQG